MLAELVERALETGNLDLLHRIGECSNILTDPEVPYTYSADKIVTAAGKLTLCCTDNQIESVKDIFSSMLPSMELITISSGGEEICILMNEHGVILGVPDSHTDDGCSVIFVRAWK